ncbi:MAG: DUF481 domain-containing protein [Candidatus Obscuribacterales bacterium]|nr:DUF481 domain-containing protein [Steroidobacteraceae bacterium]
MTSKRKCLCALFAIFIGIANTTAQAEWKGKGELGLVLARGNSESETFSAKADMSNEIDLWKHSVGFSTLYSSSVNADTGADVKSGDRFEVHGQSDYRLSSRNYAFGALRYENDRFSPYTYQAIVALGYGHKFIDSDTTKLAGEVGVGYRRTEDRITAAIEGDVVARGRVAYEHQFNASTKIFDTLLVESAADNTFLQNEAGVQVSMTESLALSVAHLVRYNTYVPTAIPPARQQRKSDQLLTANLVFSF